MSMSPKSSIVITALGVLIAATVSFLVSSPIVKMAGSKSLEDAQKKTSDMKAESKGQAAEVLSGADVKAGDIRKSYSHVTLVWDLLQWEQQSSEIVLNL